MSNKKNNQEPEVIFLVGAGMSVPLGVPAMAGIFKNFMNKSKSGITSKEKKTCEMFVKGLGVQEDLEEFLVVANSIISPENRRLHTLIEKLISPSNDSNNLLKYRKKLGECIHDVKNVRIKILEFMSDQCFKFGREKANILFKEFVSSVASNGYPVFSTNYDFALEDVALENHIKINDNFIEKGPQRQVWNPKIEFPTGDALTIIKMHGSVTWYVDDKGVIEKIKYNTSRSSVGSDVERLVIFPTRFKDIYEQHYFALYSHFLSALSSAKCLVIIGHSLRDDYLKAGIIERHRKGDFNVVVIDPTFPAEFPKEMTPAKIGKCGSVTHVPFTIENFANELASIVNNNEVCEIPEKCAEIVHYKKYRTEKIKLKGNIKSLKPGQKKVFSAQLDAYIVPTKKPSFVRVWMEAKYTANGELKDVISKNYLDDGQIIAGDNLSGLVKKEIPITVEIPTIREWLEHADKISLCIGIVSHKTHTPAYGKKFLLAKDMRKLPYSY